MNQSILTGGHWLNGAPFRNGEETFSALNPATMQPLEPTFAEGDAPLVEQAARLAREAFLPFRLCEGATRARLLETIANELIALETPLLARAETETALPQRPRLQGELARTVGQLRLFAELVRQGTELEPVIDAALPERSPHPRPDLRRRNLPLGPIAVFGASNFPLAFSVAGGDTASALAAGCPVLVKGHPAHPGTSELAAQAIVRAIKACGLPTGIFALLQGSRHALGEALVTHPAVQGVAFTGSRAGGEALIAHALHRSQPIPFFAEMGSQNPFFILPGALRNRAAELARELATALTLGCGQFCTRPGVIFAPQMPELNALRRELVARFNTTTAMTMLHPGIKTRFVSDLEALQQCSGVTSTAGSDWQAEPGCHIRPLLLESSLATYLATPALQQELFGPAALLVVCEKPEELISAAQQLGGELTATLQTDTEDADDLALAQSLLLHLEEKAGRLIFNGVPTGVEVTAAMVHGGPYPASSDNRFTSVGNAAIRRFLRPVCYQNLPPQLWPTPFDTP
ncbi:MAG: aldehyde dehydrogenase (NADP(+)) [Desulfuromonas sp.]|nr:MAG: aldehyde dehydrogenase (NADP(+)) [Desulfuromonas sp.]